MCGFASIASANLVLQQLQGGTKLLDAPPADLPEIAPARVVGYGTSRARVARGQSGLVLGYEGEGFPAEPGFGLLLVEDSLDAFKGVLIYEIAPPTEYPSLGSISSSTATLPLYGLRVNWGAVSDERCPLFGVVPAQ